MGLAAGRHYSFFSFSFISSNSLLTCDIAHGLAATTKAAWLQLLRVCVWCIVDHAHAGRQFITLLAARQIVIVYVTRRVTLRARLLLRLAQRMRTMYDGNLRGEREGRRLMILARITQHAVPAYLLLGPLQRL